MTYKLNLNDPVDRGKAPIQDRLTWICEQTAKAYVRDPRGGGFSFVAQPPLIEHVVSMLRQSDRTLERKFVIGTVDAEIVAWWHCVGTHIPFRVSMRARDGILWCLPDHLLVDFTMNDRRAAADIRMALHRGEIRIPGPS